MPNKTRPCPECHAQGRDKHNSVCKTGQARSAMSRAAHASRRRNSATPVRPAAKSNRRVRPTPVIQAVVKQLVNRVAIVMDSSGSMGGVYDLAVSSINAQLDNIKLESQSRNQASYVTVFNFEDQVHAPVINNAFIHQVSPVSLDQFHRGGSTALFDAIGTAIDRLEDNALRSPADADLSFLVIVITDGQENASRRWRRDQLMQKIKQLQGTDRWTFAFSGPIGSSQEIQRQLGFYAGNITEWENSRQGTQRMSVSNVSGISNFYGARTRGLTSTKAFFTPDMSQVTTRDLNKLQDVKDQFKVLPVDSSTPDGREWEIRPFVEDRLAKNSTLRRQAGNQYQVGKAYYELTKPEDVQPHKDIVIMNRTTGAVYGGNEARGAIGMPTNCDVKCKPGNHSNYRLFIKSTSVNRKLVRGTAVLYRIK